MLSDGQKLIALARKAISDYFEGEIPEVPAYLRKNFSDRQGVFVTLKKDGELRGCIGFAEPVFPLVEGVIKAARSAAFQDPRFPPLQKQELKDIEIELSVLTKPELIEVKSPDFDNIEIGKHGLIIRGESSGLLLPQVFSEYACTPLQALQMTCQKACLDKDCWKENRVYRFECNIYKENSKI